MILFKHKNKTSVPILKHIEKERKYYVPFNKIPCSIVNPK